jgi:hypothetical protein
MECCCGLLAAHDEFCPGRLCDGFQFAHPQVLPVNVEIQTFGRHQEIARHPGTIDVAVPLPEKDFSSH